MNFVLPFLVKFDCCLEQRRSNPKWKDNDTSMYFLYLYIMSLNLYLRLAKKIETQSIANIRLTQENGVYISLLLDPKGQFYMWAMFVSLKFDCCCC
jgi:hypothetical protein